MFVKKIKIFFKSSLLLTRLSFAVLILLVYMAGRAIPLATVPLNTELLGNFAAKDTLNNLATVTGGQLSQLTLFSLGLSPWMSAQILWRFATVFDWFKDLTKNQTYRRQLSLALVIALIQSFGLTATIDFTSVDTSIFQSSEVVRMLTIAVMTAGALSLTWLGNLNQTKGLGGSTLIIVANMLLTFFTNVQAFFEGQDGGNLWLQGILAFLAFIFLVGVAIVTYRGEYRIPIRRISINTPYTEKTYIPIRLNPAGGMPFMYGMTLMTLPPVIVAGLLGVFPKNQILEYLSFNLSLTTWGGAIIYAILLYALAIGFTYYNYDPVNIAKSMREGGDYIEGIKPGSETENYIRHYLATLSHIGAILVCFIGVVPLFFILGQDNKTSLALLVSNIFVVTTLLLGIVEQVNMLQLWKKYDKLL